MPRHCDLTWFIDTLDASLSFSATFWGSSADSGEQVRTWSVLKLQFSIQNKYPFQVGKNGSGNTHAQTFTPTPQPHWSWDPWDILCCATYYHTACWQLIVNTNLTWHRLIWTRIPVQDWIEGVGSRRCSFVGIQKSTVSCAIVYASLYNSLNTCSSCGPATLGLDRWCPDQTMRNWLSNGLTEIWGSTRSAFVTTGDLSLMER